MISLDMVLDPGAIIGTSLSGSRMSILNNQLGGSVYFDSTDNVLAAGRTSFVKRFVEPHRKTLTSLKNMFAGTIQVSGYIAITDADRLAKVPMDMHMPILQYAPVRNLFDQGRIFGFGYDDIPPDDPHGRQAIENGHIDDLVENMSKDGYNHFSWAFEQGDPILSWEEMDAIKATRDYIDYVLEETDWDPTDYPNTVL